MQRIVMESGATQHILMFFSLWCFNLKISRQRRTLMIKFDSRKRGSHTQKKIACMVVRGLWPVCFFFDYITFGCEISSSTTSEWLHNAIALFCKSSLFASSCLKHSWSSVLSYFLAAFFSDIEIFGCHVARKTADEFLEWVPWSGLFCPSESNC